MPQIGDVEQLQPTRFQKLAHAARVRAARKHKSLPCDDLDIAAYSGSREALYCDNCGIVLLSWGGSGDD